MPFDPAKPANNSTLSSAEMRGQLTGLKALIDSKATPGDIDAAIAGTSSNSNGVGTLDTGFGDPDAEALRQKLNELIDALRR